MAGVLVHRRHGYEIERHNFQEVLDPVLQSIGGSGWPADDKAAVEALIERAYHRARGSLLLRRLDELDNREFRVPEAPNYADRSDDYIRKLVLVTLDDVARATAGGRGFESFDDWGVCLVENIDPLRMTYVVNRLEGDGLVKSFVWTRQSSVIDQFSLRQPVCEPQTSCGACLLVLASLWRRPSPLWNKLLTDSPR